MGALTGFKLKMDWTVKVTEQGGVMIYRIQGFEYKINLLKLQDIWNSYEKKTKGDWLIILKRLVKNMGLQKR